MQVVIGLESPAETRVILAPDSKSTPNPTPQMLGLPTSVIYTGAAKASEKTASNLSSERMNGHRVPTPDRLTDVFECLKITYR